MKKRVVSLALVLTMCAGMLGGCGKSETPATQPEQQETGEKDADSDE